MGQIMERLLPSPGMRLSSSAMKSSLYVFRASSTEVEPPSPELLAPPAPDPLFGSVGGTVRNSKTLQFTRKIEDLQNVPGSML